MRKHCKNVLHAGFARTQTSLNTIWFFSAGDVNQSEGRTSKENGKHLSLSFLLSLSMVMLNAGKKVHKEQVETY
jgi:hypothetical protein